MRRRLTMYRAISAAPFAGKYESEYFTFEDDNCALYYKGNDEWSGKLSGELSNWLKK